MKENTKKYITNLIKWTIVIAIIVGVYFWKQDEINDSFEEMQDYPLYVSLLLFLVSILYFVIEGWIISLMTMDEDKRLSLWDGIKCALYAAFYKFLTFGSLSGFAEIYYLSKHGIDIGKATGITLVQYAYQKLGITFLGIVGFITLYIAGYHTIRQYALFGVIGVLIALFIVIFIITLSISRRLTGFLVQILNHILRDDGMFRRIPALISKREEYIDQIYKFNEAGVSISKRKDLYIKVILLMILKMSIWFSIAPIIICSRYEGVSAVLTLLLMAVSHMLGSVMVAPAGVGTQEFVISLLFKPMYGVAAVSLAILYRFYTMIFPFIIGAIVFLRNGDKEKKDIQA